MKNKTLALLLSSALMLAFASTAVIAQDKPSEKKEACAMKADKACCKEAMVCPVSGDSAKAEIFSEVKGQKVFFCCGDCKTAFDKDPAKYEAKIKKCMEECKKACADSCGKAMGGGKKCGKAGACGKDGEKKCAKSDSCSKTDGKKCEKAEGGCRKAMICPVSGKTANKDIFSEYKGQKVFFSCKESKAAFDKDPAKYEAKIKKCMEECKKACADSCGKMDGKKCGKAGACGKDGEKKCAKSDSCSKTDGKKCEKAGVCGKEAGKKPEEPAKK